ncbi:MAG: DUF2125 domain-containing protein [Rhodobacteraceae bacterium]|nr:DUF2125 domain-containing protein [Paracoccaceae bacterium]
MNTRYSLGGGALIAALLTTTSSFADVSPQEVWGSWRGYLENYGYEISADETMSGGTLTVSGLSAKMALPEDAGALDFSLGDMGFTDQGDGTVLISLPAVYPMNVHVVPTDEDDEEVDIGLEYATTGLAMVASGSVDDMTVSYTAAEAILRLASLVVDGEPTGAAKMEFAMTNLVGNSVTKDGNLRSVAQNIIAATMSYDVAIVDPEGEGSFLAKGQTTDLNMSASTTLPLEMDMEDIAAALKAGFAVEGLLTTGAGSSQFSFNDEGDNAAGNSTSGGTNFAFAMDADHMRYGFGATGMAMSLMGSDIPLPINLTADEMAFDLSMPIAKSEAAQDFSMLTKIIGLAPDPMIWGMLDPTGALPHDPATLIVDLAGKANWLVDIMDPAQAEALAGAEMPGELHSLELKDLNVSMAGVDLTGAGAFTFNNDDLETFDGLPAPDGSVDLKLVGANGLMDTLIAMGLMSNDDAMGARMMMGLFGRPGDGEDTVLSTIEVKSDGQIFANGQRLQ